MKKILLLAILLGFANVAYAAPTARYDRTIIPETTSTYELGTSLKTWLTGYFDNICLGGVCKTAWPTGGGGSGGGTFSTSTAWGSILYNFPNNLTDILSIGYDGSGVATSSDAEFVVDPTAKLGLFLNSTKVGIGTTSPYAPLSVVGQIVGGFFTATTTTASTFPSANITKLSNLTSNGFVKTGSSDGTLSVDTTTYESGLTAGDGLTRTVNDFDCDTASGSTFGCLSSTDWTTFNNKGSGTVTAVSVASSNGFAGSSSGGATPALTLSTSITGVLKGNGTAISAAANGTDYTLIAATTCGGTDKVSAISASGAVTCSADQSGTGGGSGNVATSSAETSGYVPFWTSTSATPATLGSDSGFQYNSTLDRLTVSYASTTALNVSGSLYNTSLADGCLNVTSGLIGSTGSACGAGGGGSGGGTWSTTTSTVSGRLINYPNNTSDIVAIGSNSTTTAEFYFDPNLNIATIGANSSFLGGKVYTNGLFTTPTQLMLTDSVNDLQSNMVIGNTNTGIYATGGITFVNGRSSQGATFQTSDYYTYMGLAGPNFAAFSGLPANGFVISNTDGPIVYGATSANVASSTQCWAIGSGYAVGNYDMCLKNIDSTAITNGSGGGLGIGTTSPYAKLSIVASSTINYPYLHIASSTNSGATQQTVFTINNRGLVGVGTSTPVIALDVYGGISSEQQNLATSTSMSLDFCTGLWNTNILGVSSSNIAVTFTNANRCPGYMPSITVQNPNAGTIGSTTFAAGSNSGYITWAEGSFPGNSVVLGGFDDFCFQSVKPVASTTPIFIKAFLCGRY